MRRTILVSVFVLVAVGAAHHAFAQRGGGARAGFSGGGHALSHAGGGQVLSHGQGGHGHGGHGRGGHGRGGHGRSGYGFGNRRGGYGSIGAWGSYPYAFGDGYAPDDFGVEYPYASAPAPVEQAPQFIEPPAPPVVEQPVHSSFEKYKWPAKGAASTPSKFSAAPEAKSFALVLKDGSTLSAEVVYASKDGLHYVDPDGRHLRIPIGSVDRTATLALNRARNLSLNLPASQ